MKGAATSSGKISTGFFWSMLGVLGMAVFGPLFLFVIISAVVWAGAWSPPLVVAFLAVFLIPFAYHSLRARRTASRFQMGDELYYSANPGELKKAVKAARQAGIPEERAGVLSRLKTTEKSGKVPVWEQDKTLTRKPVRGRMLYFLAGALMIGMAVYLALMALPVVREFGLSGEDHSDLTPLFLMISAVLLLLTALSLWSGRKNMLLLVFSWVGISLSVWALIISVTGFKHFWLNHLDGCLFCSALYPLIAFGLTALAGDVRSDAQIRREKMETQMGLFELGIIDEDELRRRLGVSN